MLKPMITFINTSETDVQNLHKIVEIGNRSLPPFWSIRGHSGKDKTG